MDSYLIGSQTTSFSFLTNYTELKKKKIVGPKSVFIESSSIEFNNRPDIYFVHTHLAIRCFKTV